MSNGSKHSLYHRSQVARSSSNSVQLSVSGSLCMSRYCCCFCWSCCCYCTYLLKLNVKDVFRLTQVLVRPSHALVCSAASMSTWLMFWLVDPCVDLALLVSPWCAILFSAVLIGHFCLEQLHRGIFAWKSVGAIKRGLHSSAGWSLLVFILNLWTQLKTTL